LRGQACGTIPDHATLRAAVWMGARPGARERFIRTIEDQLKKNLPIAPLLSAASLCLLPMAVSAQTPSAPSAPETSTQAAMPSAPSIPEAPSIPTSPSQPSGYPRPGSAWPGTTFEPAGTQASMVSAGQELPPFQIRAMAGVERQSNVLGLSSGAKSDTIGIAGIGFRADKRYGLQRFRADVEANTYRYANKSELDYSVFNYALAWDWSVTTKLHGVISANQKEYSEVSTDPVTFTNKVGKRTERAQGADAVYELGAAWRVLAGLAHTQSSSTQPATWDASPSVDSARVGAGYEFGSGTTLYAHYREGKGAYKDSTAGAATGNFRERETDLQLTWPVTAKTTVDARIGNLSRSNDVAKNVPAGSAGLGRNETYKALSAGVDWEPRRWLAVSGYVRSAKQDSNLNPGYRNTTIGAAAKAYF